MSWASLGVPQFRDSPISTLGALAGTTALNDRRIWENQGGNPTSVLDQIDTGRYCVECAGLGSGSVTFGMPNMTAGNRYCGAVARFKVNSISGTNVQISRCLASTTTESIRIRINQTTGVLAYSFDDNTSYTNSAAVLQAGVVYNLEVFVDWGTGTTHTLKVRINNVEVVNATGGTAIVTTATSGQVWSFGILNTAQAVTSWWSDIASYNDVADYNTIGSDWRVYHIAAVSDGTHSFTAGDFQDQTSTNIATNATTVNTLVTKAPANPVDTSKFVKQVVSRTAGYVEVVFDTTVIPAGAGTPLLVCLAGAFHPVASANANLSQMRLVSGANVSAEATIDASVTADTLEYRKHHYLTEPGGAAWTIAKVNALRARYGFSTDISPPPAIDQIMAFVLIPITTVSGTAASTSASACSAAGTASHHQYSGTASCTSASSAAAAGSATHHQYSGMAAMSSASSATATGTSSHHQVTGTAILASTSTCIAVGVASSGVPTTTTLGGGTPVVLGRYVHFATAQMTSYSYAHARGVVGKGRRQREEDDDAQRLFEQLGWLG